MLLGIWFGCLGHFVVFEPLRTHVRAINKGEATSKSYCCYFAVASAMLAGAIVAQVVCYVVAAERYKHNEAWMTNIRNNCPADFHPNTILHGSIRYMAFTFIGYGVYLGTLLNSSCCGGRKDIHCHGCHGTKKVHSQDACCPYCCLGHAKMTLEDAGKIKPESMGKEEGQGLIEGAGS